MLSAIARSLGEKKTFMVQRKGHGNGRKRSREKDGKEERRDGDMGVAM